MVGGSAPPPMSCALKISRPEASLLTGLLGAFAMYDPRTCSVNESMNVFRSASSWNSMSLHALEAEVVPEHAVARAAAMGAALRQTAPQTCPCWQRGKTPGSAPPGPGHESASAGAAWSLTRWHRKGTCAAGCVESGNCDMDSERAACAGNCRQHLVMGMVLHVRDLRRGTDSHGGHSSKPAYLLRCSHN